MRIVGVRVGAPVARLLSDILESHGYPETAGKIADAIKLQVTVEAPLTGADYDAIAEALSRDLSGAAVPAPDGGPRAAAAPAPYHRRLEEAPRALLRERRFA